MEEQLSPEIIDNIRRFRDNRQLLETLDDVQLEDLRYLHQAAMRQDLFYYAETVAPDFCKPHHDPRPAAHHRLILYWLNELSKWDGTGDIGINRLMIRVPPGSAKSTYAARIWVSWEMMRNKFREIILTSASSGLVEEHSDRIQMLMTKYGEAFDCQVEGVRGDQGPAKARWKASNKSSIMAVSAGTAIQGFRGDIIVADDLIKGVEVLSDGERDKLWEWFDANLLGRLSDRMSRMVVIGTPWHEDAYDSRILKLKNKHGEWTVITLPAIWEYDHDEPEFPYGLGRKAGDGTAPEALLWPAHHDHEHYAEMRAGAELKFQAMFQCNPTPTKGRLFDAELISIVKEASGQPLKIARAYDFASSKRKGADYTTSTLMMVDGAGHYTILDQTKARLRPHEARALVLAQAASDPPGTAIAIPKDPGQAGDWQAQDLVGALAGKLVEVYPQTGSKDDRAKPFAAQVNGNNVSMVKGDWNNDLVDELKGFGSLPHDDQVDSCSTAFGSLLKAVDQVLEPTWGYGGFTRR